MARVQPGQLRDEIRALDGRGPHHHALDAGREQRARGLHGPHAAAGLHRAVDRGTDPFDRSQVRRGPGTRRVEVDDVDPPRTLRGEVARDADGIRVVHGLGREVAAEQPHRVAPAQVDGGIEVYSEPFVLGSASLSTRTASRRQRATPLKDASITW